MIDLAPEGFDKDVARSLAGIASQPNRAKTPRRLSVEEAEWLVNQDEWLILDDVTDLPPDAAATLARQENALILVGLESLTAEAAEALATHEGLLFLDLEQPLSPAAAAALAKHRGPVMEKSLPESAINRDCQAYR